MKHDKKYRNMLVEFLIGLTLVNVVCLYLLENMTMAFVMQYLLLNVFDYLYRKTLFGKKRKIRWNIASGVLKGVSILLSIYVSMVLGLMMAVFVIVSTRMMFYQDKDRTVETLDEVKDAYFIPLIADAVTKARGSRFALLLSCWIHEFKVRSSHVMSQ